MNTYAQFCGCGAAMRPIHHIGNQSLFLCRDGHSTKVIEAEEGQTFTLNDEQIKELQRLVNEYAEQLFEEVV